MRIVKQDKLTLMLTIAFIFMITFGFGIIKVLATDNGDGNGTGGSEISGACTHTVCNGVIQPKDKPPIVKLTLVYYDGKTRKKIGKTPVWYLSGVSKKRLQNLGVYNALLSHAKGAPIYYDISFSWGNFKNIEKWIVGTNKKGIPDKGLLKNQVYKRFGISKADLNQESCIVDKNGNGKHRKSNGKSETYIDPKTGKVKDEEGSCYKQPGYRVIMEPVMVLGPKSGGHKFYTTKELAKGAFNSKPPKSNYYWWVRWWSWDNTITGDGRSYSKTGVLWRMYTEYADINISKGNPSKRYSEIAGNNYKTIASDTDGVGYYIFDTGTWDTGACEAFNPDHYKANQEPSTATRTKGSGPQGQNCCVEVGTALQYRTSSKYKAQADAYLKEFQDLKLKLEGYPTVNINNLYEVWKVYHPECLEDLSYVEKPELTCGKTGEGGDTTNFGDKTKDGRSIVEDMLGSDRNNGKGKYVYRDYTYCDILCGEELTLKFPKQIQETITKGTKLVWPTNEGGAIVNAYPLTLKGKATCTLDIDYQLLDDTYCYDRTVTSTDADGNKISSTVHVCGSGYYTQEDNCIKHANDVNKNKDTLKAFYNVKGDFTVGHDDDEYGGNFSLGEPYDDGYSTGNYKTTGFPVRRSGSTFTIEQTVQYKLPTNLYRYVNNNDGVIKSSNTPNSNNYIDLGYGNLPVSYNAKDDTIYHYFIKYSNVGGLAGKEQVKDGEDYSCEYAFEKPGVECKCTSGEYMGKDLTECMAGGCDGEKHTCDEAREKFCKTPNCLCPPGTLYAGKDISSSVTDAKTCLDAQNELCGGNCGEDCPKAVCPPTSDWYSESNYSIGNFANQAIITDKCLSDSTCTALTCSVFACPPGKGDGSGRPLNALIAQYLANHPGKTFNKDLLDYLIECSCGSSENIIYRTIDLNNPFPGKNSPAKGRRAGFNWDDETIQAKYITKNRGVNGDEIYDSSKIMYHFTLTKATVQKIRAYNAANDYSDFKLTCKPGTKENCVSDFVHNTEYGARSDGSCSSASSPQALASCVEG